MSAAAIADTQLQAQVQKLTDELYQLLAAMQYARPSDGAFLEACQARCRELAERLEGIRGMGAASRQAMADRMASAKANAGAKRERLAAAMDRMAAALQAAAGDLAERPGMQRLGETRDRLIGRYEELAAAVKGLRKPWSLRRAKPTHLKPGNYARNILHVCMGVGAVLLYEFLVDRSGALVILSLLSATAVTLEITRKRWAGWNRILLNLPVLKQTHRPAEVSRVNSATIFSLTLFAMVLLAPMQAVEVGLLVLALGDPAGSIFGRNIRSPKLWHQKTVAGTLAVVGVSFLALMLFFALKSLPGGLAFCLTVAGVSSVAGAATELFSERLDDNFSVLAMTTAVASLFYVL